MVELAGGMGYSQANASFTGPGKTPWNVDYWSGGSFSRPGAGAAAGPLPPSARPQTSGSNLPPAGCRRTTGLRPTYRLASTAGALALTATLVQRGPMARETLH